jgi:electron transport complex protein RnfA
MAGNNYTFIESLVNALGVGIGFLLAMVLFSGMRQKIQESEIPESFKGLPATLIAASFISLAFFGFGGIVENLFA